MGSLGKLTIRVGSSRGASTIQYSTNGKYVSLPVNTLTNNLKRQPIQPTASAQAFWLSVLAIITADITAGS